MADALTEDCAGCGWPARVCEGPCCTACHATNGGTHLASDPTHAQDGGA